MKSLSELQMQYYEEFKGLPSYAPIVRNNQPNDAFELVVLKVMFGKYLPDFIKNNAQVFSDYIIAPPDSGIDIFFQHEHGDEYTFDVIQVKNQDLDESQIKACILTMERTIEDYCKDPKKVGSESCKTVLSKSSLDKTNKSKCTYYVVHTGSTSDFVGSEDNERVITLKNLEIIYKNISDYVDCDSISIASRMTYGSPADNNGAIVCSMNGFALATLCNTYYSTDVGRNILFGSNLRESLITKKSKPFLSMSHTILSCPENFWYYNNGITIIARDISEKDDGSIELKGFSIVNGAQTTSALGLFLREANKNHEKNHIEQLKKVFVLTRILKVPDEKMRQEIAIFNNTQNPITSRDMVANRPEQRHLNEWLLDDNHAQIYCEIRRGSQIPANFNKGFAHRKTTNEELAQLAYAAFMQQPFTAKDKKSALFNNDYSQPEYIINKIYHDIFNWDESCPENSGLIFKKSKQEIDELLFVQQLYKESKRIMKTTLSERNASLAARKELSTNPAEIKAFEERMTTYSLHLDTVGICMFYFIALYYEFKVQFPEPAQIAFRFDRYYSDKSFRQELVQSAANLFLSLAVSILVKTATENGKSGNVNNWIRSSACETAFLKALRDEMVSDFELEQKYKDFCAKFKA